MGRIKTTLIKRVAMRLLQEHRDSLAEDFEENKRIVAQLTDISSKKFRNAVAGYITRKIKKEKEDESEKKEQSFNGDSVHC